MNNYYILRKAVSGYILTFKEKVYVYDDYASMPAEVKAIFTGDGNEVLQIMEVTNGYIINDKGEEIAIVANSYEELIDKLKNKFPKYANLLEAQW